MIKPDFLPDLLPRSAAVLSVCLLAACSAQEAPPPVAEPPLVSTLRVQLRSLQTDDDLPGRVAAVRTAEIRPQVGGIVQRRLFEQGAEVKAGQVLYPDQPRALQGGGGQRRGQPEARGGRPGAGPAADPAAGAAGGCRRGESSALRRRPVAA